MTRSVELTKRAARDLDALAKSKMLPKILSKIASLSRKPEAGKPLVGPLRGIWSLRVGEYRILYKIDGKKVVVLTVNLRKDAYR